MAKKILNYRETPNTISLVSGGGYNYVMDLDSVDRSIQNVIKAAGLVGDQGWLYTLPKGIPGKKGQMGFSIQVAGLIPFALNLKGLAEGVAKEIRLQFVDLARQILQEAVEHAPYETGQLRERGLAKVGGRLVARGTNSDPGTKVDIAPRGMGWASDSLTISIEFNDEGREARQYRDRKTGQLKTRGYPKQDNTFLVSVWTHENMEYKAQTPGTGPKYLENAMAKFSGAMDRAVKDGLALGIKNSQLSGAYK